KRNPWLADEKNRCRLEGAKECSIPPSLRDGIVRIRILCHGFRFAPPVATLHRPSGAMHSLLLWRLAILESGVAWAVKDCSFHDSFSLLLNITVIPTGR